MDARFGRPMRCPAACTDTVVPLPSAAGGALPACDHLVSLTHYRYDVKLAERLDITVLLSPHHSGFPETIQP
jgi:hypothetical protein